MKAGLEKFSKNLEEFTLNRANPLWGVLNDFDIPVIFEGYGESMNDLRKFQFEEYLDRLL